MTKHLLRTLLLLLFPVLWSCGDDDDDNDTDDMDPKNLVITEGDYVGRWVSTADVQSFNVAISAKISEASSGKFSGQFFISSNFTSCCNSGADDGTITFNVSEDKISSFIWDDVIPNCEGTFTGEGTIIGEDSFRIDFTGNDCDGDHTGSLTLSK